MRRLVFALLLLTACGTPAPTSQPDAGRPCSGCTGCEGHLCVNGFCDFGQIVDYVCNAGRRRCHGHSLEVCNDECGGWTLVEVCAGRCQADPGDASCVTCTCDPASPDATQRIRCEGDEVMVCRADCSGYDPLEKCSNGCDPVTAACR